MRHRSASYLALLAAATALGICLPGRPALAQSVRIFDDAPSIEQLRSIMIPESPGGAGRSIVLGHPSLPAAPAVTATVATQSAVTPRPSITTIQQVAAAMPPPPRHDDAVTTPAPSHAPVLSHAEAVAAAGVVGIRIGFALDAATLPPEAHAFLDRIGALLLQEKKVRLRIEGHTDALGSSEYNLGLSQRRAQAVAAYLVEKAGIGPDRLLIVGMGKTAPLTSDPYDPHNRRVQFVRID